MLAQQAFEPLVDRDSERLKHCFGPARFNKRAGSKNI
jgi:hypothetical protein